ncbi:hypothetical protein GE061_016506 [Apolygus lucorum]|uniref:glutathione transferase n=1 Tax=Apolygus lucorum TaxID=248454 RepID=A0A8S9XJ13_APOLU|nr:hypothetical protein GE061_016506 [Apolygus lucorum]
MPVSHTENKMPSYKVTYFDIYGLGEPIRMLLSYMGVDFEDNRVPMGEWSKMKNTVPFGKLPTLEIDGKTYYQSHAILRMLAKEVKLAGDNTSEAYEIDFVAGTIQDLQAAVAPMWGMQDEKAKEEFLAKVQKEIIPMYFKIWDERAQKNGGYLANGKLSWVDLLFHGYMNTFEVVVKTKCVDQYAGLKLGREKVSSARGIKEWIARRPKTNISYLPTVPARYKLKSGELAVSTPTAISLRARCGFQHIVNKMPTYKLTYFDFKGWGEPIRMFLSYMGVDFEDNRIPVEEWDTLKKTIPFGKLPFLEIDGKTYYQSFAILRMLAKEIELAGDNANEEYEIDFIAGTIKDTTTAPMWRIEDPIAKEESLKKIQTEIIPMYFKLWDERAQKNGGYLANGKLSWVDIFFHGYMNTFEVGMKTKCVDQYPGVKLGREKVSSAPGIKKWIARRPKTDL